MRRFVFALVLFPLAATAQPATAQPAGDALVDRVVAVLQVEAQSGVALGPLFPSDALGVDPAAIADSVRAAFRADFRPDLIRAALATLEGPAYVRFVARTQGRTPDPGAIVGIAYGGSPPKKGSLADSLLADRYVAANGLIELAVSVAEQSIRTVVAEVPEARLDLDARGQTVDEAIAGAIAGIRDQTGPLYRASARLVLAGVPVGDVEAAIAYAESAAGRYVRETTARGVIAAVTPGIVRLATASLAGSPFEGDPDLPVRVKPGKL